MSKRDGGPCSNCGGTVYYDKGSCVACTGARASKRQREQLKELRRLRAENVELFFALIKYGSHDPFCPAKRRAGDCDCGFAAARTMRDQ